jgi:dUTP pyrophosphatase
MKITKIRDVKTPTRGTEGSAGIDFYVPDSFPSNLCNIEPYERYFIPSGIKANVPEGYALIAMNKSGVALKKGLMVGAAVVDSDYQGEIHLHLINCSNRGVTIKPGDKLVQFLLVPVSHCSIEEVSEGELYSADTERGEGGFGSTGSY